MRANSSSNEQSLKFALAEFRFSQVLQIIQYIPKLQETLRKHYPIIEQRNEQAIHVQPGGITVTGLDRWSFLTASKKSAIDVNQERLVYYTTEYSNFNCFIEACTQALEILNAVVEPSLIIRIGLRYGNLVEKYIKEEIFNLVAYHLGFPEYIRELGEIQHQSSETSLATTVGKLVIRTLYGKHRLVVLPDIQGLLPVMNEENENSSERIILDVDHFWESNDQSVSFESNKILEKLYLLHEISKKAFLKVTTEHVRSEQ